MVSNKERQEQLEELAKKVCFWFQYEKGTASLYERLVVEFKTVHKLGAQCCAQCEMEIPPVGKLCYGCSHNPPY